MYNHSPLGACGQPTNFVHEIHVGFDPVTGRFTVRYFSLHLSPFNLLKNSHIGSSKRLAIREPIVVWLKFRRQESPPPVKAQVCAPGGSCYRLDVARSLAQICLPTS